MGTVISTSFRLSRVYAQGWNAARRSLLSGEPDAKAVMALNPYTAESERTRWNEGFAEAMQSTEAAV
jgi:hypothetical protein